MRAMQGQLSRATMDKLIGEHYSYESDHDLEGVLATLTGDAAHDLVGDPAGVLHGPTEIRSRYEHYYQNLGPGRVTSNYRLYGADFAVTEETWTGPVPGEFAGIPGNGRQVTFRMLHVFQFRGELIHSESLWIDTGAIIAQLSA
jgi:predicted ester cyclase